MDAKNLVLGRQATEKEKVAIEAAQKILSEANLELIGTRPNDR